MIHLRQFLELAYFVSSIVLALAAVYGLQQIRLLKQDIRTRNERAAKEKAIEYSGRYLNEFVHLIDTCTRACRKAGIPSGYAGKISDFNFRKLSAAELDTLNKRLAAAEWHLAFNELEVVAAAFMTGVADEHVGFKMIGATFCACVRAQYDLLALIAPEPERRYYRDIFDLYRIWSPRLTEAELNQARDRIDALLAGLPTGEEIKHIGHATD